MMSADHANLPRADDAIVLSRHDHHHDHDGDGIIPAPPPPPPPPLLLDSISSPAPKTLTPLGPAGDPSCCFFKTRLCTNFSTKGFCAYAQGCTFAHGLHDLRSANIDSSSLSSSLDARTRLCKMYLRTGDCSYGANCTYLHVNNAHNHNNHHYHHHHSAHGELPVHKSTTNPCFSWRTSGRCSYGDQCRFIHHARPPPPPPPPPPQGSSVEAEGGHKTGGSEGSSRSKCNFSFKSTVLPSRLKKGSEKLNEIKKVDGIYGDWLE